MTEPEAGGAGAASGGSAGDALSDATRGRLEEVRRGLLGLHGGLLDSERRAYEQVYGRIGSSGELLQLVLHHSWFAWLRPVSARAARLEERLASRADPAPTEGEAAALLAQVRDLLRGSSDATAEGAEGSAAAAAATAFGERYRLALQQDPDVILAHAGVMRLLPPPEPAP